MNGDERWAGFAVGLGGVIRFAEDAEWERFHREFERLTNAKDHHRPTLRYRLRLALSQWLRRRADRFHPA